MSINIDGGLPSLDSSELYSVEGSGIASSFSFSASQEPALSYSDGTAVTLVFSDSQGCSVTFNSEGPVTVIQADIGDPCFDGCGAPGSLDEHYDCPPLGLERIEVEYTMICNDETCNFVLALNFIGGLPGIDSTEVYSVVGTGLFPPVSLLSNDTLFLELPEGTLVDLSISDTHGCQKSWSSNGPMTCYSSNHCGCSLVPGTTCNENVELFGIYSVFCACVPCESLGLCESEQKQYFGPRKTDTYSQATAFDLADFNNDGALDIVACSVIDSTIVLLYNDGQGNFVDTLLLKSGRRFHSIHLSDLDNDGDKDIVFGSGKINPHNINELGFYLNDGGVFFGEAEILDTNDSNTFKNLRTLDLNGDGNLDIAASSTSTGAQAADQFRFYARGDDGSYSETQDLVDVFLDMKTTDFVDLNNDGFLDVIGYSEDLGGIVYYPSNNGSFEDHVIILPSIISPKRLLSRDLNEDGLKDLLLGYSTGLVHHLNDGQENFSGERVIASGMQINDIVATDNNGDGDLDLITTGGFSDGFPGGVSFFGFYRNDSQGNFSQARLLSTLPRNFHNLTCGDLDGDEDLDLLFSENTYGPIFWRENNPQTPQAGFEFVKCSNEIINSSIVSYFPDMAIQWYMEDEDGNVSSSNTVHPEFDYSELGNFLIVLEMCNEGGCDTITQEIEVTKLIDFHIPIEGEVGEEIEFSDGSTGFTNWTWTFGDGAVSLEQSPSHIYEQAGLYSVDLFLTDSTQVDCTFHQTQEIEIFGGVGIEGNDLAQFEIWPNPSFNFVIVETTNFDNWNYELIDANGSAVLNGSFTGQTKKLTTSNIASGIYFLSVKGTSQSILKRLIVLD